jgi:hypothetical protein
MKKINLGDLEFERYEGRPEGYRAGIACFGKSIGAAMLGATVYDTNETDETVRVMLLSTMVDPALAVYPDSDKIGVFPGEEHHGDHVMVRRESHVDYYDRET